MPDFNYHYDVEVRFSDLDALGHVNNARFLTYMEQARINYFKDLGLWSGNSLYEIGFILADAHVNFRSPILFGQAVSVQLGITRLGNKSMTMHYRMVDKNSGRELSDGSTVLVTYDYHASATVPIPPDWRAAIRRFEGLAEDNA